MRTPGGFCLLLLVAGVLTTCQTAGPPPQEDPLQVVRDNFAAAQKEDIYAYMRTIHPESPQYDQIRRIVTEEFAVYDFNTVLQEASVVALKRDSARVKYRMLTEKINGPAYRNNISEGIFLLKAYRGYWKIYARSITAIEYFEKKTEKI